MENSEFCKIYTDIIVALLVNYPWMLFEVIIYIFHNSFKSFTFIKLILAISIIVIENNAQLYFTYKQKNFLIDI
jgi:hypothetical protein